MSDQVTLFGTVTDAGKKPLFMIRVVVVQAGREVQHGFTGEDGRYSLAVPAAKVSTVDFDTHETLNNARSWHPSLLANIDLVGDANGFVQIDRTLLAVGMGAGDDNAPDLLAGYLFGLMRAARTGNRAYAAEAAPRLRMLKIPVPALDRMRELLAQAFDELRDELRVEPAPEPRQT